MKPGIYENLPVNEYLSIEAVSNSSLKSLNASPRHFWACHVAPEKTPVKETDAMRVGRAIHTMFLEPAMFNAEFAIWDGRRSGDAYKDFQSENADKTILTRTQFEEVEKLQRAAFKDKELAKNRNRS